jgi:hypothetical protein
MLLLLIVVEVREPLFPFPLLREALTAAPIIAASASPLVGLDSAEDPYLCRAGGTGIITGDPISGEEITLPSEDDELSITPRRRGGVNSGVDSTTLVPPVCNADNLRTRDSSSIVAYPFRSGKGPHDIGTEDVFGLSGRRGEDCLGRRRKQRNKMAPASRRPATAAPIAIPTISPEERPVLLGMAVGFEDEDEVEVAVAVAVDVKRGGRLTVGGISMDAHADKLVDKQQKEVAFGDVRPQYWHNCGKLVPNPQFSGSFTNPSTHDELKLAKTSKGKGVYLSELAGSEHTVKSALTRLIRKLNN